MMPDSFYAEVVREMALRHDWVRRMPMGSASSDKPPLFYLADRASPNTVLHAG